jgi:hypothetical protein
MLPKMLLGTVIAEMKKCGRANCHCAHGESHGPYFYRLFREYGRLHKSYVKPGDLAAVKAACEARAAYADEQRQERQQREVVEQQGRQEYRRLRDELKEIEEAINAGR